MSKLTKQHFESAAEEIRTSYKLKGRRERNIVMHFLADWFKQWNPEFDRSRFEEACNPSLTPKGKSGGLKKAIAKYKAGDGRRDERDAAAKAALERAAGISPPSPAEVRKAIRNEMARTPSKPQGVCVVCGLPYIGTASHTHVHPDDIDDGRVDDTPEGA